MEPSEPDHNTSVLGTTLEHGTGQKDKDTHNESRQRCTSTVTTVTTPEYDELPMKSRHSTDKEQDDHYTIQEAIDHMGFGWFQIKLSVLAGMCWMTESMELMLVSILGPVLECEWLMPSWKQALLSTLVMVGMTSSSSLWGALSDKYGRKTALLFASVLSGYFGLLTAISPVYEWVAICRFLVGFSVGAFPQTLILYSEYLPIKTRAVCIVFIEMFFAIGAGLEVLLAKLIMPTLGWRYLVGASALPVLCFPLLGYWLPESARFHLASGNYKGAVILLEEIAADNRRDLPPGKLSLIDNLPQKRGQLKDLFIPELRKTSIILYIIYTVAGLLYYGLALLVPTLLTNPDGCHGNDIHRGDRDKCNVECEAFSSKDYDDIIITGFADMPGLLFISGLLMFLGRKTSMSLTSGLCSLFLLISNICFNRLTLTLLLFCARALHAGFYQGVLLYNSEVYPTHIRSLAMGMSNCLAKFGSVLTPFIAQVVTKQSAYASITTYGVLAFVGAVLPNFLPVETMGRAMEDSATKKKQKTGYISLS